MKRAFVPLTALAVLALLSACDDMHDQPSVKAQEAPRRSAPATAVPVRGNPPVNWQDRYDNPEPDTPLSRQRGATIFQINCAMCHGSRDSYLGAVGRTLVPPPPSLHDPRIRALDDSDLFKRVTLGFGRMPAFERLIPAADRWHLVNYLHTFR